VGTYFLILQGIKKVNDVALPFEGSLLKYHEKNVIKKKEL
jgi:hypothetical protein